jgi:hypothetical protein
MKETNSSREKGALKMKVNTQSIRSCHWLYILLGLFLLIMLGFTTLSYIIDGYASSIYTSTKDVKEYMWRKQHKKQLNLRHNSAGNSSFVSNHFTVDDIFVTEAINK